MGSGPGLGLLSSASLQERNPTDLHKFRPWGSPALVFTHQALPTTAPHLQKMKSCHLWHRNELSQLAVLLPDR